MSLFQKYFVVVISLLSGLCHAATWPRPAPVPGGVAIVALPLHGTTPPPVYYQERRVLLRRENGQWQAVVGIALGAIPGTHALSWQENGKDQRLNFMVGPKSYAEQHIKLKETRMVDPSPADLVRIEGETRKIKAALAHWSATDKLPAAFSLPVQGEVSGNFGLRRFFNGKPRKPHSGLDIAAPTGTPIRAPAAGRVLDTGAYFFNGNSVFLDHGAGLVSMYCHLDRIDVKPGQWVEAKTSLGAVGKTGRATGAHLHWGLSLNGALVDPGLFLAAPD